MGSRSVRPRPISTPRFATIRGSSAPLPTKWACSIRSGAISAAHGCRFRPNRSEEHTSELQSLMRNSYAVFCLKKKQKQKKKNLTSDNINYHINTPPYITQLIQVTYR